MNSNHEDLSRRELNEARLTAYALGELDAKERAELEAKLAHNEKARRTVEEMTALAGHVCQAHRQTSQARPSASLHAAVEKHLSQLEEPVMETKPTPPPADKPRRSRWPLAALAVTVCLLLLTPLFSRWFFPPDRELARSDGSGHWKEWTTGSEAPAQQAPEAPAFSPEPVGAAAKFPRPTETSSPEALPLLPAPCEEPALDDAGTEEESGWQGEIAEGEGAGAPADLPAAKPTEPAPPPVAAAPSMPPAMVRVAGPRPVTPAEREPIAVGGRGIPKESMQTYKFEAVGPPGPGPGGPGRDALAGLDKVKLAKQWAEIAEFKTQQNVLLREQQQLQQQGNTEAAREVQTRLARVQQELDEVRKTAEAYRSRREGLTGDPPVPPEGIGTEQYDPIVEKNFNLTRNEPISTFSADVDTASYSNVRRFLRDGRLPPPGAVRIEEMINYFNYDYPLPEGETPFSVNMEVASCPWNPRHRLLRIGLKGREVHRDERGPSNLVFLLDVSGSMRDENKLPLVKQAMEMLVKGLNEDDRVAIVTYASSAGLRLPSTCADEKKKILSVIDDLQAGGSTHGSAGIKTAYEQATKHFVKKGANRVILCTDGDLNVGITDDDELVEFIKDKAKSGVFLTVLGFGTGNLKNSKLEKLADNGNGNYAYIDDVQEAHKVLVEEMSANLVTIAKDVKLQVDFNLGEVYAYRLIGYENRVMARKDFDDDTKDAGEIGAGHTVTALYELVPRKLAGDEGAPTGSKYRRVPKKELNAAARSGELLTLGLRYKKPDEEQSQLLEFVCKDDGKRFAKASGDFRFAAAVASFGMLLRNSPHCGKLTMAAVEEFAGGALGQDPHGYRGEFVDMIRRARAIRGG